MESKNILIGVCGGIAAYKACDVVSQLSKCGYSIKVMMTKHATKFVSPLTFETLTHNKVAIDLFDDDNEDPIAHINLAKWADCLVLVPATANMIAKVVHGIADDMISTTCLACTCPKLIFPAMNVNMYENPVTQQNLEKAKELGFHIIEPVCGHLACNDIGKGKLVSVPTIVDTIKEQFQEPVLKGKTVLISAGPTQEALDPVRYLTNHSSGKQGYALANQAKNLGANVILVAGPNQCPRIEGVEQIDVENAQDMFDAMVENAPKANMIVMSAAVSDYRFEQIHEQKIKKTNDTITYTLVKNPDILAHLGKHKQPGQIICGFAMETENLEQNAKEKLINKNCDMLVANNLFTQGAGFQTDTNVVTLFFANKEPKSLPLSSKDQVALEILLEMHSLEEKSC